MKDEHEDGKCYACRQETKVRWKNLYTIGSEGTWLCLPCELKIVHFLIDQSRNAMIKERDLIKKKKRIAMYPETNS
jgi:hypothetical protein